MSLIVIYRAYRNKPCDLLDFPCNYFAPFKLYHYNRDNPGHYDSARYSVGIRLIFKRYSHSVSSVLNGSPDRLAVFFFLFFYRNSTHTGRRVLTTARVHLSGDAVVIRCRFKVCRPQNHLPYSLAGKKNHRHRR